MQSISPTTTKRKSNSRQVDFLVPQTTQRPIEFRCYDTINEKMYPVTSFDDDIVKYAIPKEGNEPWTHMRVPRHSCMLMQFTGLYDKNKKKIFEGDILEFTDKWEWYRGVYGIPMMFANKEEEVILREKYEAEPMHRFEVVFDSHEGYNISKYDLGEGRFEIIGNIYENPELLKNHGNNE